MFVFLLPDRLTTNGRRSIPFTALLLHPDDRSNIQVFLIYLFRRIAHLGRPIPLAGSTTLWKWDSCYAASLRHEIQRLKVKLHIFYFYVDFRLSIHALPAAHGHADLRRTPRLLRHLSIKAGYLQAFFSASFIPSRAFCSIILPKRVWRGMPLPNRHLRSFPITRLSLSIIPTCVVDDGKS